MNIKKTKASHDIICIVSYFIIASAISIFYSRNITEGYVTMAAVLVSSFSTAIISLILILILKKLTKTIIITELLFGLFPLFIFEIIYLAIGQPLLFGLFGSNEAMYEGSELAMSLSSLTGVLTVYGFSIYLKTKHNTAS